VSAPRSPGLADGPEARDSVGPYRLIRAIGAGGSARIDLARIDRAYNFQRHVVIKRPLEHLRGDPKVAASLRREARIGGMLRHPNLVAVLDAGVHDDYDYLVLEYVHGTSLRALMQPGDAGTVRRLPLPVALGIVIDVARGLHDAHELGDEHGAPLGLVHRDVSPGNVLLGLDGAVKLADFGIAKETRVNTLSGSMHGTVTYMAPEQCRGHAFDRRADLFSVGVILYELVTCTRLFWADNDVASLHKVLSGNVTPPRTIDATISPALESIVMTAIAHDPAGRFATARQLGDALEALAASEGHVVGARWLARTLEEEVGPKHAPWIAATTAVDAPHTEPEPGASLVDVIASLAAEQDDAEPLYSTFGPSDERAGEEGSLPSPPVLDARPAPAPRRNRWAVVAGVALAGIAAGIAFVVVSSLTKVDATEGISPQPPESQAAPPTLAPSPSPSPTPAPSSSSPAPAPAPPTPSPAPAPTETPVQTSEPPADLAHHRPRDRGHIHHGHQTNAPPAESNEGPAMPETGSAASPPPAPPPPAHGSGSAATDKTPANPVWHKDMLLPTDSGSNAKKRP
jgi:eukaryotic-like serine/threonine-protein kinase